MIAITNRSGADVPLDHFSEYTVQINAGPTIARFTHRRGDPLSECLLRASRAVKEMEEMWLAESPLAVKNSGATLR